MNKKPYLTNIKELLSKKEKENILQYGIACFDSSEMNYGLFHSSTLSTDAYIYVLVRNGSGFITINYKTYKIAAGNMVVLTPVHIIQFSDISEDFNCEFLIANKAFMDIVPSMEKVFKHLNRSLKLYSNPIVYLPEKDKAVLSDSLEQIEKRIEQTDHLMQKEMIQNAFISFLLEWINYYEQYTRQNPSEVDLNRSEQILKSFISLLKKYFKREHHVPFYATRLHLTPQYLTLIVKELTGHTINDFIYDMLYSEARILLTRSELSVQQITDELHFSDPSAFCKFFKRRSGISPLKFRKK